MSRLRFAVALLSYLGTAVAAIACMTALAIGTDGKTVTLLALTSGIMLVVSIVLTVIP